MTVKQIYTPQHLVLSITEVLVSVGQCIATHISGLITSIEPLEKKLLPEHIFLLKVSVHVPVDTD